MQFTVHSDADYGFIVADAAVGAKSFAIVPVTGFSFNKRSDAERRARELSGTEIETKMIETPERFEAVADKLYGPAWGNY